MIEEVTRKRVFDAAVVTAVAAGVSRLLSWVTGYFYALPMLLVDGITGSNEAVSYLLALVLGPSVGVVFWRQPWWARWACLGTVVHNVWWGHYMRIF